MTEDPQEFTNNPDRSFKIFEDRNRAFRFLYDTIIDVERSSSGKDVFKILASNLRRICNGKAVFLGIPSVDSQSFILKTVDFCDANIPPLDQENFNKKIPVEREALNFLLQNSLEHCDDIEKCLGEEFYQIVYQPYHSLLGNNIYRFACLCEERIMGMGFVVLDDQQDIKTRDIVKIYLNLAGLIIYRVLSVEQLKESEENLKTILESLPAGVLLIDRDTLRIIKANSAAENMVGTGEAQLEGQLCDLVFCHTKGRCPIKDFDQTLDFSEKLLRKADGSEISVLKSVVPVTIQGKRVFIESFIDISERKSSEGMIAAEKERLAVTLRSIGDGVITVDKEKRVVLMNKVAENLTGCRQEDVFGNVFSDVFSLLDPETKESINHILDNVISVGSNLELSEGLLVSHDGTKYLINQSISAIRDANNNILGAVLVFRDITEKRKMEDELFKKRKLESLGVLAGGIAHDFNNILAVIVSQIAVAKIETNLDAKLFDILREIEQQALRAKGLTHQLMTFSKGGNLIKKISSVKELMVDTANFVLHGSNVECQYELPNNLWTVVVDKGQFNQVIQNIVLNAKQSLEDKGGKVFIKAENINVYDSSSIPLDPGKYIKISIKDNGPGIPLEDQERIFDPYYTTKKEGSGLGLATVFSIIKRHEGYITVISEENQGAEFQIYLPALGKKFKEQDVADNAPLTGSGKILLMDDEEALRDSVALILQKFGYSVATAINGEAAIDKYRLAMGTRHPFDVVVLDLTVKSGLGGKETLGRLKSLDPGVKAIAISGYSDGLVLKNIRREGFDAILTKPFAIEELIRTIKRSYKDSELERDQDA